MSLSHTRFGADMESWTVFLSFVGSIFKSVTRFQKFSFLASNSVSQADSNHQIA